MLAEDVTLSEIPGLFMSVSSFKSLYAGFGVNMTYHLCYSVMNSLFQNCNTWVWAPQIILALLTPPLHVKGMYQRVELPFEYRDMTYYRYLYAFPLLRYF